MPVHAWVELPLLIVQRLLNTSRETGPWMVGGAVRRLNQLMQNDWAVLELGSGRSTEWYARRSNRVLSLESDRSWLEDVVGALDRAGLSHATVEYTSGDYMVERVRRLPAQTIDVVIVDCDSASRLDCVVAARDKVRPGGYLVLDDSDREEWRGADAVLAGWHVERFTGMKPTPLVATETSIFRRPDAAVPE